jgi:two-component system response regulator MprA
MNHPILDAISTQTGINGERGKLLILVVERDPYIRELEAHFLQGAGYSVAFAVDGPAALQQARELQPDVIVTEVLVPKLDGLALCRKLKEDPATRNASILVFSILAVSERAKEAGADAFLSKPLAERHLVSTVDALLKERNDSRRISR